jgi:hypothetical protein
MTPREPPTATRTAGLAPRQAEALRSAARALTKGDASTAELSVLSASIGAAEHPEVLRWQGLVSYSRGRFEDARAALASAHARRPADATLALDLVDVLAAQGADREATAILGEVRRLELDHRQRLALAIALDRLGHATEAAAEADRLLAAVPGDADARLIRIRCRQALGDAGGAAADARALLRRAQRIPEAWFSLLELKTEAIADRELASLRGAWRAASGDARVLLGFALARAEESAGDPATAFATLADCNGRVRAAEPWDFSDLAARIDALDAACGEAPPRPDADAPGPVVFLVGLPRSGSTLFEQILAAHPAVEAASELPYVGQVLDDVTRSEKRTLAQWAETADDADWKDLGERYLQRSARWRERRPTATDKLPHNWHWLPAIRRMLPQARIIDCRRDALETCWSCYKQRFAPGAAGFAQDFGDLARYWHLYTTSFERWSARWPARVRTFHYQALVDDPETQIRSLLEWCGLPFDAACLAPHLTQRAIRTASALQVRQPIGRRPRATDAYGALLDPLRAALGIAPWRG